MDVSWRGSLEDVRAALSSGANVNCTDSKGLSPLMWACKRDDDWTVAESIVRELLSAGAVVCQVDDWQRMAIHFAAACSSRAVVTMLLEAKSPVDPPGSDDDTPLLWCCVRNDEEALEIARVLLDRGADVKQKDQDNSTPLLEASRWGSAALVELLLSRGADVTAVSTDSRTALMLASRNDMHGAAIIPLLVCAGVNVNAVTRLSARTCACTAIWSQRHKEEDGTEVTHYMDMQPHILQHGTAALRHPALVFEQNASGGHWPAPPRAPLTALRGRSRRRPAPPPW
jgi:ankyrin repeat protein